MNDEKKDKIVKAIKSPINLSSLWFLILSRINNIVIISIAIDSINEKFPPEVLLDSNLERNFKAPPIMMLETIMKRNDWRNNPSENGNNSAAGLCADAANIPDRKAPF